MGLNDREYMREVPIYKALTGRGPTPPFPPLSTQSLPAEPPPRNPRQLTLPGTGARGTKPWAWFLLGAIAMLVVILYLVQARPQAPAQPGPAFSPTPAPPLQVVPAPT
jgi:hypothetical protein